MKEAKVYIKDLFYFDGPNKTTPDCPVKIVPDYDPTNGKKTLVTLKEEKFAVFAVFA